MSLLRRLFGRTDDRSRLLPLYQAVVARARVPDWYARGRVPDTLDGRFDMVATILSLVLLRLERDGEPQARSGVLLTEIFVEDMDGQLREAGVGDVMVGKHVGRMMSALGGRLGAYRAALAPGGDLDAALDRNLYRGAAPDAAARAVVAERLLAFRDGLDATGTTALLGGQLPLVR